MGALPHTGMPLWVLFCAVVSYCICGIPFGKIIAGRLVGIDLQKVGSGNIGSTNALREGGVKVAVPTLLCDVLKGVLCMNASRILIAHTCLQGEQGPLVAGGDLDFIMAIIGLTCVIGHMFSPYLHFKGGKSIAVGVGVLFAVSVPWALIHLAIFIVLTAATKFVSVGSIVTSASLGITSCLMFPHATLAFKIIMTCLGALVVWAHRGNIKKLRAHDEAKLPFGKRVDRLDG